MKMFRLVLAVALAVCSPAFLPSAAALTPEQVIALKKAGVAEETIRLMIQQEKEARQASPHDTIGRREISDDQGNAVIIYSTGRGASRNHDREEREKVDKAWKMLQNMVIDGRAK